MAQDLKSDMSQRAILEPRNLKERHDLLAERVNEVKSKGFDPGSVAPMAAPGSKSQFVVYYFAGYRDGRQLWEVDKRNQKFVIDGKDYWAEVRKALGE